MMRWTVLTSMLSLLYLAQPAEGQAVSFNGLGSASRKADVERAFPAATVENFCAKGELISRHADGATLCEQLTIPKYNLDGIRFDVSFLFDTDGYLRYINLEKMWPDGDEPYKPDTVRSVFTSLADLISSKYGPAVEDPPGSFMYDASSGKSMLQWQPGRGSKWQSGGDRIELRSEGEQPPSDQRPQHGSIQLFYTFSRRAEFNRF